MSRTPLKIALYASYQTGEEIPGYVRYALAHLAKTDFKVVLLTNERTLSQASYEFLADNNIGFFFRFLNRLDSCACICQLLQL